MKTFRAGVNSILGSLLLVVSIGWFAFGTPASAVAQKEINVTASVPEALDVTVSTAAVAFGTINPNSFADKVDAFTLTVKTNKPTWYITAWTESAYLLSNGNQIAVQDNLLWRITSPEWSSPDWSSLSNLSSRLFGNAEFPTTPPTSLPVSLRLKIPQTAVPGDYSVKMLIHFE